MPMTDENLESQPSGHGRWPPRLRRPDASRYLKEEHGIERAPATLAKLAVTGGGPEYELDGRYPLYRAVKLDEWVASRLKRRRSTSDRGEAA